MLYDVYIERRDDSGPAIGFARLPRFCRGGCLGQVERRCKIKVLTKVDVASGISMGAV